MKTLPLIALLAIAASSHAGIYKHVDENGNITYTDKPPGNATRLKIQSRPTPKHRPAPRSSGSMRDLRPLQPRYDSTGQLIEYFRERARKHDAKWERIEQRWCQRARDRLAQEKDRWKRQRTQGYTQQDQDRHRETLRELQDEVARECR